MVYDNFLNFKIIFFNKNLVPRYFFKNTYLVGPFKNIYLVGPFYKNTYLVGPFYIIFVCAIFILSAIYQRAQKNRMHKKAELYFC